MRRWIWLWVVLGGCAGDDGSGNAATSSTGPASTGLTSTTGGASSGPSGSTTAASADTTADSGPATTAQTTGDTTADSSTGPGVEPCPPGHECFVLDGVFHVPNRAEPTAQYDIPLPPDAEYGVVEVTLDVTHGGWFPDDPAGLHNLFWLHRGTFNDFTWVGGVLGYVNVRGPNTNIVRTRHDLDVADLADSQNFNINGISLQPDLTYTLFYRYDAAGGEVRVELTESGQMVAQGTDVPTTDLVRNTEGGYFIYFANGTDVEQPGPEVPSLGWTYANLRVEFIP